MGVMGSDMTVDEEWKVGCGERGGSYVDIEILDWPLYQQREGEGRGVDTWMRGRRGARLLSFDRCRDASFRWDWSSR